MTPELRERCRDAVQVVTSEGDVYAAGMACSFLLEGLGYRKLGRMMRLPPMRPLVEWGYRRVANNRDLFGRILFRKERPR